MDAPTFIGVIFILLIVAIEFFLLIAIIRNFSILVRAVNELRAVIDSGAIAKKQHNDLFSDFVSAMKVAESEVLAMYTPGDYRDGIYKGQEQAITIMRNVLTKRIRKGKN